MTNDITPEQNKRITRFIEICEELGLRVERNDEDQQIIVRSRSNNGIIATRSFSDLPPVS